MLIAPRAVEGYSNVTTLIIWYVNALQRILTVHLFDSFCAGVADAEGESLVVPGVEPQHRGRRRRLERRRRLVQSLQPVHPARRRQKRHSAAGIHPAVQDDLVQCGPGAGDLVRRLVDEAGVQGPAEHLPKGEEEAGRRADLRPQGPVDHHHARLAQGAGHSEGLDEAVVRFEAGPPAALQNA